MLESCVPAFHAFFSLPAVNSRLNILLSKAEFYWGNVKHGMNNISGGRQTRIYLAVKALGQSIWTGACDQGNTYHGGRFTVNFTHRYMHTGTHSG